MLSETLASPPIVLALQIGYVLLGLAFLAAFARLALGPTDVDRVLALDLIAGLALTSVVLLAIAWERSVFLDVALCLAVLSFLGTVAFARFLRRPLN